MRKKLLIAAILFVIVVAGVAVYFYNNIDSIVKNAIERSGSEITGTKVSVGSVDISLESGRGTIRNVRVENPDGFSDEDAVTLDEVTLVLEVGSLNRDPIVIQDVLVKAPVVNAEVDEKLLTNMGVIRSHVQDYQAAGSASKPARQDAGYGKHFTIKSFVMKEGIVHGDATRVRPGEKREFDLPPLELSNVGGSRGSRPELLGKAIAAGMFARIEQAVADELKAAATQKIEDKVKEILNR
ncbi:MAG TPA: hypothetical protein VF247_01635 [Candidatus Krumholzibacteria bacterium]